MPKKAPTINVTVQRRVNPLGIVKFRALVVINDFCIDGWGNTSTEAEEALKLQMAKMAYEINKKYPITPQDNENSQTAN